MQDNFNNRMNKIIFRFAILAVMLLGIAIAAITLVQSRLPSEYEKNIAILAEQNKELRKTNIEYTNEVNSSIDLKNLIIEKEHVFYNLEDSHAEANNGQKMDNTFVAYTRDNRESKDGYDAYVKFALNGQFQSLTGCIYVTNQALRMPISDFETEDWNLCNISIYADGELCYTKTGINYKSAPIPVVIDTSGVEILEIRFNPNTNHRSGNSVYTLMGIGNVKLDV